MTPTPPVPNVAYLGATLPSLSETFVYQELLAVRATGLAVIPVSVFQPRAMGTDIEVDSLASEAVVTYCPQGFANGVVETVCRPLRSLMTLLTAASDLFASRNTSFRSRIRTIPQAFAAMGLARQLRQRGVSHIHAHMANTPTTLAMYAAAHLGIGFSFTGHANDLFVHQSMLSLKLRRADFVACISRWHREYYRRIVNLSDDRSPVVRCGVATPADSGSLPSPREVRGDQPCHIVSVGRLVPKKGMDTLILAIKELGEDLAVECDIVGDGAQRAELEAMIASHGLERRVRLLGSCPNSKVLDLVRRCDVFVLACKRDPQTGDQDGIPVSLMEAMAAARCVITSAMPPVTELVIDGSTGLCVPENDPRALAATIRSAAIDPVLRCKLGSAGFAHVADEFDRTVNAQRLRTLYVSCANGRRS